MLSQCVVPLPPPDHSSRPHTASDFRSRRYQRQNTLPRSQTAMPTNRGNEILLTAQSCEVKTHQIILFPNI